MTVVYSDDAYRTLGGGEPEDELPARARRDARTAPDSAFRRSAGSQRTSPAARASTRRVSTRLPRRRFDVVHFHNVSLVGGPGVLRYGDGIKLYTTQRALARLPDARPLGGTTASRATSRTASAARSPSGGRRSSGATRACSSTSMRHVDLFLSPSRFTIEAHRARGFTGPMRHPARTSFPAGRRSAGSRQLRPVPASARTSCSSDASSG